MSYSPAQNDRAQLMALLKHYWRHDEPRLADAELPEPLKDGTGATIQKICPVFGRGEDFDPKSDDDMAPFTAQQVAGKKDLSGLLVAGVGYLVAEPQPAGPILASSSAGDPGRYDRDVEFQVRIVTPAVAGYGLATAYASALALIMSGVSVSLDDPYEYCIVNHDHPTDGPRRVRDDSFWAEWAWSVNFVRTSLSTIAGPAQLPVMAPSGRVVVGPSGDPVYA